MARTMRRLGYPKSKTLFMAWIDELAPDNAAAEGFFGRMKTESVYPEHWEERTRDEVLVLIDDYIRWYNHERIKQSLGWMSPVQYRQSQGMAA